MTLLGGCILRKPLRIPALLAILGIFMATAVPAQASHSWGTYHWGRTSNPFTLKLGDNLTTQWDAYLTEASSDWNKSTVLGTTIVAGSVGNVKRCSPPNGRVEVCNSKYGFNGWLGVAGIFVSGGHITAGYVKLNDSYFNSSTYNKPEWRRLVMCQEIGHTFGLDHQDEAFDNPNLGTCMDYTNSPAGNEHPNQHDYDQLVTIYGSHTDGSDTNAAELQSRVGNSSRSRVVDVDSRGNGSVTWILWAN